MFFYTSENKTAFSVLLNHLFAGHAETVIKHIVHPSGVSPVPSADVIKSDCKMYIPVRFGKDAAYKFKFLTLIHKGKVEKKVKKMQESRTCSP